MLKPKSYGQTEGLQALSSRKPERIRRSCPASGTSSSSGDRVPWP